MTQSLYRKPWEQMTDQEKLHALRGDITMIAADLAKYRLAHQNLMSAHEATAQTLKETVTALEDQQEELDRLRRALRQG